MSKIKIITDSSCDLHKDILKKYDIDVVKLNVAFGEETYLDGEMDNETFYNRMANEEKLPKTSCCSPEKFADSFECEEESIIVLTITSKLSATYSTAILAKNIYLDEKGNNKRIEIIDTQNGSVGHGLLVTKAAQMASEGKSVDEIIETIERLKEEVVFFGGLETLENAIKGGRISKIAGSIINALNFKVVIQITDGLVKPVDKARGDNNCLKKVIEKVSNGIENKDKKTLYIAHSNCEKKAIKAKDMICEEYTFEDIVISEVGPVMGTYTSKGAILVAVL